MLTFPRVRSSRLSQYIVLKVDPVCVIIVGPRVCGHHPRHLDLRLFWDCCGIWSVSPFCLCATYTAPPLVLLRCRKPHIPSCGRVLRRGYCYQMLWGIYQVRLYRLAFDELRWLMRRTATLSLLSRSFPMLLLRYTTTCRPLIPTHRRGHSVGVFGLAFSWLYLYHCLIFAV